MSVLLGSLISNQEVQTSARNLTNGVGDTPLLLAARVGAVVTRPLSGLKPTRFRVSWFSLSTPSPEVECWITGLCSYSQGPSLGSMLFTDGFHASSFPSRCWKETVLRRVRIHYHKALRTHMLRPSHLKAVGQSINGGL